MKNKIEDLRNHLFVCIENIMDEDKNFDIERARAVSDIAQTIINSAKVEIQYLEKIGGKGTGFVNDNKMLDDK